MPYVNDIVYLLLLLTFSVFIIAFEQVNAAWVSSIPINH